MRESRSHSTGTALLLYLVSCLWAVAVVPTNSHAQASAPPEIWAGSAMGTVDFSSPQPPGCVPNVATSSKTWSASDVQLQVSGSLLTPGSFTATLTATTISSPTPGVQVTCSDSQGNIVGSFVVLANPGGSETGSFTISGTSDGQAVTANFISVLNGRFGTITGTIQNTGSPQLHLDIVTHDPGTNVVSDTGTATLTLQLNPCTAVTAELFVPSSGFKGEEYQIDGFVRNNGNSSIQARMAWQEHYTFPLPIQPAQSGVGTSSPIPIIPRGGAQIFKENLVRSWQWIPPIDPLDEFQKELGSFAKDVEHWEELNHLLGAPVSLVVKGGELAATLVGLRINPPPLTTTINYTAQGTCDVAGAPGYSYVLPHVAMGTITLKVPPRLQYQLAAAENHLAYSDFLLDAGVAAFFTGLPSVSVPAVVGAYNAFQLGRLTYANAIDPLDNDYTHIAKATIIVIPELVALPDGPWKQFAHATQALESFKQAEATSLNRAGGARAAGDSYWESKQLFAAAGFAAEAATASTRVGQEMQLLLDSIQTNLAPLAANVNTYLQTVGLPPLLTKYLTQAGWTDQDLADLRTALLNAGSDVLQHATTATLAPQVSSVMDGAGSANTYSLAVGIRLKQAGQTVEPLSAVSRESLDEDKSYIEAALQTNIPSQDLLRRIKSYIGRVRELIDETNDITNLNSYFEFGFSALLSFQQMNSSVNGLQLQVNSLVSSGAITDPALAKTLTEETTLAAAGLAAGRADAAEDAIRAFIEAVEEGRGKTIVSEAADGLIAYASAIGGLIEE